MAKGKGGHFSNTRESWISVFPIEITNFIGRDEGIEQAWEEEVTGVEEHRVRFRFTKGRGQQFHLNLTLLTEPELDMLKDFLNRSIEMARPAVQQLDREAKEAWERGENLRARSYRQDPKFYTIGDPAGSAEVPRSLDDARPQPKHRPVVQERHHDDAGGDSSGHSDGDADSPLSERDASDMGADNDEPEAGLLS